MTTTYAYNNAGRMASLTIGSVGQGPYLYNGFGQLASRTITANPTHTIHMVYDQDGNLIFEANALTGEMLREYIWLQGRPVAVIDAAADSQIYAVHVDHLDRPVMMTNYAGAIVWQASYLPFGEVRTSTGPASLNYRFPGQWFMLETGLHYNWHRWYDASTGRYTQPDPIGMPDGPNRFVYALNSPLVRTDRDGRGALPPGMGGWLGDWLFGNPPPLACPAPGIPVPFDDPMFGRNESNEDCATRWGREKGRCGQRYSRNKDPRFYGGCIERARNRFMLCIQNGGRPDPAEPPEWDDWDEEEWRNPFR